MDDQRALSSGASSPQINDPDRIFPGPDLRKLSSGKSLTSYIAQAELCKSRLNSVSYLLTGQFNM